MSMELFVVSKAQLTSIEAWQATIEADGFPLQLAVDRPLEALSGALPAQWRGARCAFECDYFDLEELRQDIPGLDPQRQWSCVLAIRFGGDPGAAMAAYLAASSYARATGGVVFDDQQGEIVSPERAAEIAWEIEASLPVVAAAVQATLARARDDKDGPS